MRRILPYAIAAAAIAALAWQAAPADSPKSPGPMQETDSAPEPLANPQQLDSGQWRQRLTPEQYRILRQAGTERPGGPVYQQFKQQGKGAYHCAGCGARLFASEHKFDAHCGWPSFWDPAAIDSVETRTDTSLGMVRTEVVCARCKGHLGHLFTGEGFDTPTDQRYCINGTALVFVEESGGPD
jgi:peptide-methionine (R)-S-oxide reductase